MNNKQILLSIGRVALFAVLMALMLSLFLFVFSTSATALDHSRPGFSGENYNETLTSDLIAEALLGISLSDEEKLYLKEFGNFTLIYPKYIPSTYVTLTESGATVDIAARPYSYTASSGIEIICTPKSIAHPGVLNEDIAFPEIPINGEYKLTYTPPEMSDDLKIDIKYTFSIEIVKEDLNELMSKAYLDALYLSFLADYAVYEEALVEYNTYLADKKSYEEKYADYLNYLSEKSEYESDLALYGKYLEDLEKYNSEYLLYLDSVKKAEGFEDEIVAYREYLSKMEKVNYRLSLLSSMKTQLTGEKRSLYAAIMGKAVDEVLENESLLTGSIVGADKNAVKAAGESAKELRDILQNYNLLSDDEDKYIYYKLNYSSLEKNLTKLFASLDNLYANDVVRETIILKGKAKKFDILLAQLYLASSAFSDDPVYKFDGVTPYSSNYKIQTENGKKTPYEILGTTSYYIDKNIATPAPDDIYPTPVPKPEHIPLDEPVKPKEVKEPLEPTVVPIPQEPSAVEKPIEPENPGIRDIDAVPPFEEGSAFSEIVKALKENKLSDRKDLYLSENMTEIIEISVSKALHPDIVTLTYHDANGEVVGNLLVDSGSFADIGYTPVKPDTERSEFKFVSWADENGNAVDLSSVTEDMMVYPLFEEVKKKCEITWVIDGISTVSEFEYDTIPDFGGIPAKDSALAFYYEFCGWDKELVPVSENAVYTAVFDKKYTIPELESDNAVQIDGDDIKVICGNNDEIDLCISRLVSLAAGKNSLRFVFGENEIHISFSELADLKASDVSRIKISKSTGEKSFDFCVLLTDSDNNVLAAKFDAVLEIDSYDDSNKLITFSDGEKIYQKHSFKDGKLFFVFNTGSTYSFISEYSVSSFNQDGVNIGFDKVMASAGDTITVNFEIPEKTRLTEMYYVNSNGEKTVIKDGSFIMPNSNVTVGLNYEKITYTVTFISDGIVISKTVYEAGTAVVPPANPTKPRDDMYTYVFISWSPEISEVTADATYTAVYQKIEMPEEIDDGGLKISPGVMKILITAGLASGVFVLGFIPSMAMFVVFAHKRKKLFNLRQG